MSKGGSDRPYECVKRAWHSEKHQPMRGSIIQRILRVATEVHSPDTKKNREWQTKFPCVVMKAEQILYSKASSEAEYKDPNTLWERLNDAINTIIRRDESETGQYIQPCIEAALILGCEPVRGSRSQQLKNPRKYLSSKPDKPIQPAQPVPNKSNNHMPLPRSPNPPRSPNHSSNQSTKSGKAKQASTSSPFKTQLAPNTSNIATNSVPHLQPIFCQPMPSMTIEPNASLNFGSVYPLYYDSQVQNFQPQVELQRPHDSSPKTILIGRPVGWPTRPPAPPVASTMNLLPSANLEITGSKLRQVEPADNHGKTTVKDCDLSLRLGISDPSPAMENALAHVGDQDGDSSNQESEHGATHHEFRFFPKCSGADSSEFCDNKGQTQGDFEDKSETPRKRKAHEFDGGNIHRLTNSQPGPFDGKNRWPGLGV